MVCPARCRAHSGHVCGQRLRAEILDWTRGSEERRKRGDEREQASEPRRSERFGLQIPDSTHKASDRSDGRAPATERAVSKASMTRRLMPSRRRSRRDRAGGDYKTVLVRAKRFSLGAGRGETLCVLRLSSCSQIAVMKRAVVGLPRNVCNHQLNNCQTLFIYV